MSGGEKRILDGLKKAKVSKDLVDRTRSLVGRVIFDDGESTREIEAVARYLCGVAAELPPLSEDFRESRGGEILEGLSRGRTPDAWDLRAVEVLARMGDHGFGCLEAWIRDRVARFPEEPIFDEALPLLRARGWWPTDDDVLHSLLGALHVHLTGDGALTSTGRAMLARIDRDPEAVLAAARRWQPRRDTRDDDESDESDDEADARDDARDQTYVLHGLLAKHRRAVFDRICRGAPPAGERDRVTLLAAMLRTDPQAYEAAAAELVSGLTEPVAAAQAALLLERHLPGSHPELLQALLSTALRARHTSFWDDQHVEHDTHRVALDLSWRALGAGAIELWRQYRAEDDVDRLGFYERIEAQAKETVVPWLVEGLVHPWDPAAEYAHLTHAEYVAGIARLLRRYDLQPFRERIAQAFAGTTDRRIAKEIAALLGKRAPAPSAAKPRFDPRSGYAFDVYAAAVVKHALRALERKARKLPAPIEEVKLTSRDDGEIPLSCIVVEGGGEEVAIDLGAPRGILAALRLVPAPLRRTRIPSHIDLCAEEDDVLPRFARLHGLEEDDGRPAWGDDHQIPDCVLAHEHLAAAQAIAAGMREMGLALAEDCRVGIGRHDSFEDDLAQYAAMAREGVAALPEEQQADFAALCFVDPRKQAWLLGK